MTTVDAATVKKIARLARLEVTPLEVPVLEKELNTLLAWVEQLDEVNTDGVEPMTRVVAMTMKMRDDVVTDGGIAADVVANAPVREGNYFMVPKVVE
jgi:aspartyl-tRNA(Asn)/glutamyl-tRNA(Gln) amidotransferase subunit C